MTRPPPDDDGSRGGWSQPGAPEPASEPEDPPTAGSPGGPRYTLGALLGQGGMGLVHAARDRSLGRDVALKELHPDRARDQTARARLAREAAITGRLDHPAIVAVHEMGSLPDGRPYYTMRLVRGRALADVAAGGPEARRGLARHLLAAAEAVAAAHDAGLVHRDLKPANILVGAHGETQVIDWGLAAPTPAAEERWRQLPGSSARGPVGTDRYMSPEQRAGRPPDPRDDVHSLGVTIREVLGEPLDAELSAVVARATAPDPAQRYPDAGALAADLLAWFEGRRVSAHVYTPGELLRRAVAAYRLPLAVGVLGLLGVGVAAGVGWARTAAALDRALSAEATAAGRLAQVQLEQAIEATRAGQRERAERLALAVLEHGENPVARGVFASFGRAERPTALRADAVPACRWAVLPPGGTSLVCGGEGRVERLDGLGEPGGPRLAWSAALSSAGAELHGDTLLTWDSDGRHLALDVATGVERGRWPRRFGDWQTMGGGRAIWGRGAPLGPLPELPSGCVGRLAAAATSAEGRVAALCDDGTLLLGDPDHPARRRVATPITGEHVATAVTWTAAGELLVGTVRGRLVHLGPDGQARGGGDSDLGLITQVVAAPDGRHAAVLGVRGRVGLWRVDTGTLVAELREGARALAFGAEGLRVYADDGPEASVETWRLPSGAPALIRAPGGLADVVAAPGGGQLAITGGGWAATVDLRDGTHREWRPGDRVVKTATWRDGVPWFTLLDRPHLAAGPGPGPLLPAAAARPLRRLATLSDGSLLGVDMDDGLFRWADPASPPEHLARGRVFVDLEADGDELVLLDHEDQLWRWAGRSLDPLGEARGARAVAKRGERIYIAGDDGVRQGTRHYPAPGVRFLDVAVSPDGRRLAASALSGWTWVWDVESAETRLVLTGHRERAVAVEFLPDGGLATASWDGTARIADLGAIDTPVPELAAAVAAAWGAAEGAGGGEGAPAHDATR